MKTKNQILQDQPKFNFTPPPYILDPKFYDFLFQNCSLKRLKNESSPRPYPFFFFNFPIYSCVFQGVSSLRISWLEVYMYFSPLPCALLLRSTAEDLCEGFKDTK